MFVLCSVSPNKHLANAVVPAGVVPVMAYTATKMALVGMIDRADVLTCIDGIFYRELVAALHRHVQRRFGGVVPREWLSMAQLAEGDMDVARDRFPSAFLAATMAAAPASGGGGGGGGGGSVAVDVLPVAGKKVASPSPNMVGAGSGAAPRSPGASAASPVRGGAATPTRLGHDEDVVSEAASPDRYGYRFSSGDGGGVGAGVGAAAGPGSNSRFGGGASSDWRQQQQQQQQDDNGAGGYHDHSYGRDTDDAGTGGGVAAALQSAVESEGGLDDLDALLADVLDDGQPSPGPAPRRSGVRRRVVEEKEEEEASEAQGDPRPRRVPMVDHPPVPGPLPRMSGAPRRSAEGGGTGGAGAGAGVGVGGPWKGGGNAHGRDLESDLRSVAQVCYATLQVAGLGCCDGDAAAAGPAHVMEVFSGTVPTSLGATWLTQRPELARLCLRAFRMATKAAIDAGLTLECEAMTGDDADSIEDLMEVLKELHSNWCVGMAGMGLRRGGGIAPRGWDCAALWLLLSLGGVGAHDERCECWLPGSSVQTRDRNGWMQSAPKLHTCFV